MEQQKSLLQDETSGSGEQPSQNSRTESIQRCISSLVHSCQCRDANCRRLSCHKMKRVVQHTKMCKKRQTGPCPVCKQLIALCCYHAKHCQEQNCLVPFCPNIRQKLAEQQAQLRKKREREMVRRINLMGMGQSTSNMPPTGVAPGGGPATPVYQHPQQSPLVQHNNPPTPGGGGGLGPPMIPQSAVLAAKQVEQFAAVQSSNRFPLGPQPMMNRTMTVPPGVGMANRGPPQMNHNFSFDGGGNGQYPGPPNATITNVQMGPNYGNMRSVGGPPMRMPNPGGQQPMVPSGSMPPPGAGGPNAAGGGIHIGGAPQQSKQLNLRIQEVLQALKSAKTEQETQSIIKSLHKDPQLMQAFIQIRNSTHPQPSASSQNMASNQSASVVGNQQQQQQMWNMGGGGGGQQGGPPGGMMPPGTGVPGQRTAQFYPGAPTNQGGGVGPRISQQGGQMQNVYGGGNQMDAGVMQRHMNTNAQFQNYGAPSGYGGMNAGLRQPVSPQQQQQQHQQNFLQQHRSPPPGGSMAQQVQSPMQQPMPSPSPHHTNSPHVNAGGQPQSSLHHLLDHNQGQPPDSTGQDGKFM